MATKQQVIDLNKKCPHYTARDIAEELDCMVEYVNACKTRYGLRFARGNWQSHMENSIGDLGRAARRRGLSVADIEKLTERRQA